MRPLLTKKNYNTMKNTKQLSKLQKARFMMKEKILKKYNLKEKMNSHLADQYKGIEKKLESISKERKK